MKKIILGIILSIILVYLSLRGINIDDTFNSLKNVNYSLVFIFFGIILFMQFLRSYRLGIILKPLQIINQFTLFAITSVGFLAIAAIPARLGELARPYLIAQKSTVKFSSALGTIIVERALDGFAILLIMSAAFFFINLPSWAIKSFILFFIFTFLLFLFIIALIWKREKMLILFNTILSKLPESLSHKIDELIYHFIHGLKVIKKIRILFYLFLLSIFIWLIDALAIYTLFLAFGFTLPAIASIILMIILIAGIAIPTAPGYIGNWHFACILGLSIFGIAKSDAFSFAVVYHFLSMAFIVFLGVLFLPFNKFSFSEIKKQTNKVNEETTK